MSEKSSTFAPAFEKRLLNGVMVALQILVLSVWVRVLVEQQSPINTGLTGCSSKKAVSKSGQKNFHDLKSADISNGASAF